jgi:hypothetical protein
MLAPGLAQAGRGKLVVDIARARPARLMTFLAAQLRKLEREAAADAVDIYAAYDAAEAAEVALQVCNTNTTPDPDHHAGLHEPRPSGRDRGYPEGYWVHRVR